MIGIIGYGMVGKAVEYGFNKTTAIISDPKYNDTTVWEVCNQNPDAIFVCVPTPTDDTAFQVLRDVLDKIANTEYAGLVVVKSTALPVVFEGYDVIYNPEFLSRATSYQDFVKPPFVLIGGDRGAELLKLYKSQSIVDTSNVFLTDIKTASLAKYTMNSFYAVKIAYMNEIYDIAQTEGVNYRELTNILSNQPWMGTHHFQVPGPDGERGFGGPCLPKDAEMFDIAYDINMIRMALALNTQYRNKENNQNGN
jgi:UDPglucose 6-dehydrogenase